MTDVPEVPLGYRAPILRGVWERITTMGVLRIFSHVWVACCLAVGLWTITYLGFRWLAAPFVLWVVGHAGLFLLTQWNQKWDDMFLAQLVRNYKDRYDAA